MLHHFTYNHNEGRNFITMTPKTLDYKKLLHARTLLRQTAHLSEEAMFNEMASYLTEGMDASCFQEDGRFRQLPNSLAGALWKRLGDYGRDQQRTPYDRSCIETFRTLLGSLTNQSGFKYWLRAEMTWGYTCREDYGKTFCRTGDKHMISLYLFKTEKDANAHRTKLNAAIHSRPSSLSCRSR